MPLWRPLFLGLSLDKDKRVLRTGVPRKRECSSSPRDHEKSFCLGLCGILVWVMAFLSREHKCIGIEERPYSAKISMYDKMGAHWAETKLGPGALA